MTFSETNISESFLHSENVKVIFKYFFFFGEILVKSYVERNKISEDNINEVPFTKNIQFSSIFCFENNASTKIGVRILHCSAIPDRCVFLNWTAMFPVIYFICGL